MEAGLTFGSLGDIIAVCQLAIRLGQALGSSRGSVKEYRELREEIDAFVKALLQVLAIYPQHESSPYLTGLDAATRSIVYDCAKSLRDYYQRLQDIYGSCFSDAGSSSSVAHSAQTNNATLLARVEELKRLVSHYEEVQQTMRLLSLDQNSQLHSLEKRISAQESTNASLLSHATNTFCVVLEIKDTVNRVCQAVVDLRALVTSISSLRLLDPTKNLPLFLEDALGARIEIPLHLIHSWEMFHVLLAHQFENRKGHRKVLQQQYALEESCTSRDLDRSIPWTASVRNGMTVSMSILLTNSGTVDGACPRCCTYHQADEGVTIHCTNTMCGMRFRVESRESPVTPGPVYENGPAAATRSSIRSPVRSKFDVEHPSDFQRVRLFYYYQPTSWEETINTNPSDEDYIIRDNENTVLQVGGAELDCYGDADITISRSEAATFRRGSDQESQRNTYPQQLTVDVYDDPSAGSHRDTGAASTAERQPPPCLSDEQADSAGRTTDLEWPIDTILGALSRPPENF
ncbi:hypothetical protein QBC35DRAFT_465409 [Podospora australis]|uniref:Ubiquitin-like domain-containing protein n=1 Tax=Podospora australis TaxID=1536484 RepID=A0AAN7AGB9_9PEZI|nr:hypothetical protein QBC35DRAFT_465409 [Podospora australis]